MSFRRQAVRSLGVLPMITIHYTGPDRSSCHYRQIILFLILWLLSNRYFQIAIVAIICKHQFIGSAEQNANILHLEYWRTEGTLRIDKPIEAYRSLSRRSRMHPDGWLFSV